MRLDWTIAPSTMLEAVIVCVGNHLGAAIASLHTQNTSIGLVIVPARTSYTPEPQSVRHRTHVSRG